MSEAISTNVHESGEAPAERLHPLFLLTGLGSSLRGMIGGYVAIAFLAAKGMLTTALLAALAIIAVSAVSLYLYWRRFEYRVGANEIRIDSGIISRTHRSIPFDRVQDVDISQGPIARLLGLAEVKFETGASAGAKTEEGILKAIALQRAEQLRQLVRARRSSQVASSDTGAGEGEAEPDAVFAMDVRRLILAGLFNFSLAIFAGLIGLTQTAGDLIGFDPLSRAFWQSLLSASDPLARFFLAHQIATGIAGVLLLVLVGFATGIVRTLLREYGFRLHRTGVGLRRRRGLLTLTDVTLPVRRAQAAIVATGPVRDRFGWRELKLQSLARDEGGSGDHVLAPLADEGEVGRIIGELGWRPIGDDVRWSRVSRAYVTTLAIALSPLVLLAVVQSFVVPLAAAAALVVITGALAVRWLAWRHTAYALDSERILIRTGWWRRRTLLLPITRIQTLEIAQSFVARRFGICSLVFGVAGGSGFSAHAIPALEREKAFQLRKRLLSHQA